MNCSPEQAAGYCPTTRDEVLPSIAALLPQGPAWRAVNEEGSIIRSYWAAMAVVLAFTYKRLCEYVDEFFCATIKESMDQWLTEYGIGDPCDPYGVNLCAKVAAQGGARCEYFTQVAFNAGWVITCRDLYTDPEPIAGCFEAGCTQMAGPYEMLNDGSNIGIGTLKGCNYGEVVGHPEPDYWRTDLTHGATCLVPGSYLGLGPQGDESCCFIVGYYEMEITSPVAVNDFCSPGNTITFDCPRRDTQALVNVPCDATGKYRPTYTNAYRWEVTIDVPASEALQGAKLVPPDDEPISAAGRYMAGDMLNTTTGAFCGTPLCAPEEITFALCFLERVKPAHTVLITSVDLTP